MVDAILECGLIFISLFYLCNKLKMPYACFYIPQASSPHTHTHTIHTVSTWVRNATHLSVAQNRHWYTNAYIQCGRMRDIDAIWKSHLTHTAWDKWEKNLCCSRAPWKKLFLKIVALFGFVTLWYTKAQMPACYQKGVRGRDGTWLQHRRRIGHPQLPPLTQICKQAGPSLRRQLHYAHPPTGSSTSTFPWLPGKSWLPSCLPELPPFRGQ